MEKEESAKFIQYMAKKLNAKTQAELETALTSMGEEKLKAAYEEFKSQPTYKKGGVIYLECLKKFKKGGVVNCGCGKKMDKGGVVKAQWGAILGAAKGVFAGANTAGKLAQGASTAMKVGKGLQTAGKVIDAGKQIYGSAQQFMKPAQTMPTQQVAINPPIPSLYNPIQTQNQPILNQRAMPTFAEDGAKLKKLKDLKKFKKFQAGGSVDAISGKVGTFDTEKSDDTLSFGQAFRKNRASGAKEFTYKGKRYTTKTKEDDAPARTSNTIGEVSVTAKKKTNMLPEVTVTAKKK